MIFILIAAAIITLLSWFLFRKRRKIVLPDEKDKANYEQVLGTRVDYYQRLSDNEKTGLKILLVNFCRK